MKRIIELLGLVFPCVLSVILANLNISLHVSVLYGVILLILWIFFCIISDQHSKSKKIKGIISSKDSQIEELKKKLLSNRSCLEHRSSTAITDFIREAQKNVYVSGIINNNVLNILFNDRQLITRCKTEGIRIHIMFYVSEDEKNIEWYLKMLYGNEAAENKIEIDKINYKTTIESVDRYEALKELKEQGLLQLKRLGTPATTAFLARDIEENNQNGKIQCQFYQYKTDSPNSPVCQLFPSDEMFSTMRNVILNMWDDASSNLNVNYIENITTRIDKHN